ncbi:MAG: S1/P1 nuclease [Xanthomonadales bacterium]|jgi:hypothetical protein|nr:S1/P1 nuclease [Xanthomonadales bacterium]
MKRSTSNTLLGLILVAALALPSQGNAWGARGHGAIGVLAVEQLSPEARGALAELLGATDLDVIVSACVWSDTWRGLGDGRDQSRWHYVNIDPDSTAYQRGRDCPEGDQCVTAQVNAHAAALADTSLDRESRRLAFKGLCHFTGDLHQPLHVGYADDRGGNDITIRYRAREMNLHRYWDSAVIEARTDTLAELVALLRERPHQAVGSWQPADTLAWTNESWSLTRNFAYPPTHTVDEGFETRSWNVMQQQLDVGAARLAAILEWVLVGAAEAPAD